jgi:hypothetical protein
MRTRFTLSCVLIVAMLAGCGTATQPCGTFTFNGTPISNAGITCDVNFNFNPGTCSSTCTCNSIAYIQIVRIIDRDTGDFRQPHSAQFNRMVTGNATVAFNGWAVDRLASRVWGYYGRNNDGTFASTLTPGSNTTTAILRDTPSGWAVNNWFDAVSVPVCIDAAATCNNRLLGFEYWLFVVTGSGAGSDPFSEIGRVWHADVFDLAVAEWNSDTAAIGANNFPAMPRL